MRTILRASTADRARGQTSAATLALLAGWVLALLVAGCSTKREVRMDEARRVALEFVEALCQRDYDEAYRMTSAAYRAEVSQADMQARFEQVVPLDFGPTGPLEVGQTMQRWPDKQPSDLAWIYVNIGGEDYNEAVTVAVTREGDQLAIRPLDWGRP